MDLQIAIFINHLGAGTILDIFTQLISNKTFLLFMWSLIALIVIIFDQKQGKKFLIAILIATILHFLISEEFFKNFLGYFFNLRVRPYLAHPNLITLIDKNPNIDASFPSSHMSATVAIITVIIYFYKKYWPLGVLFVLAMGFARIHNGVHYPTDVLGGITFGILYGLSGIYFAKILLQKKSQPHKKLHLPKKKSKKPSKS